MTQGYQLKPFEIEELIAIKANLVSELLDTYESDQGPEERHARITRLKETIAEMQQLAECLEQEFFKQNPDYQP